MSNNENLPRLFDDHGHLLDDVDTSQMDPATRERYGAIVTAYQANEQAQAELDGAMASVTAALEAIKKAEEFHNAHWRPQTQHDLWLETFGGGPHRARGLA
jgi:hypothetical protein